MKIERPPHFSVACWSINVVESLLKWGADVFERDSQGRTLREIAQMEGQDEMVAALKAWKDEQYS